MNNSSPFSELLKKIKEDKQESREILNNTTSLKEIKERLVEIIKKMKDNLILNKLTSKLFNYSNKSNSKQYK